MKYKEFRFTAELDWVEFEILTEQATNFQTIKRHACLERVHAVDEGAGGAASHFVFRIQDVQKWSEVKSILERISRHFPLAQEPTITAIEVAFDAYSLNHCQEELIQMTGRFYRFAAKLSHTAMAVFESDKTKHRTSNGTPGEWKSIGSWRSLQLDIRSGRTIYIGNHRRTKFISQPDDICQRIYLKTTDRKAPLKKVEEHRARIEITLQGKAVPFRTILEAEKFNFESLAPWFKFRKLRSNLNPYAAAGLNAIAQVGEQRPRLKRNRGFRQFSASTEADGVLNAISHDKLRDLTSRLRGRSRSAERVKNSGAQFFRESGLANSFIPYENSVDFS